MHYMRWRRTGDPTAKLPSGGNRLPVRPPIDRFTERVDKNGPVAKNNPELGRCWIWLGLRRPDGYGQFSVGKRQFTAHRWLYEIEVGPVGAGKVLDHFACDGGPDGCVNPTHVRPVTYRENVLRGESIGARYRARTHCNAGHLYDEENTRITRSGSRVCRACHREDERRRRREKT